MIRFANDLDYVEINKLFQQVHDIHVKKRGDIYKNYNALSLDDFNEILSSENEKILVYDNNGICGLCYYVIKFQKESDIVKERKYLYIDTLVVDKKYRKNGIGKLIYDEIKNIAINNNCKSVDLNVWSFNNSAIKFYKHVGMNIKSYKFEDIL